VKIKKRGSTNTVLPIRNFVPSNKKVPATPAFSKKANTKINANTNIPILKVMRLACSGISRENAGKGK
jgi:hypothetical protein